LVKLFKYKIKYYHFTNVVEQQNLVLSSGDVMYKKNHSELQFNKSTKQRKWHYTLFTILITILLFTSISLGSVSAESSNDDNAGLGWILFYITLIVLIVIVVLWIVTYFIMRGVINRLEGDRNKIRRYESRKEADVEKRDQERDRERRRHARTPTGTCLVCNRKFIPGSDGYQCDCGKFIHVHCLAELSLCPHCGRDIDKDTGVVRLEGSGRDRGSAGKTTRTKINRLIKAKFCPVCNKIIKAGDSGMECDCGAVFHGKCSEKTRICPKCGN
jgi:hypothetical protein